MLTYSANAVGVSALLEMRRAYVSLLESEVFPFERRNELQDKKMAISFKKSLMGEIALDVLFIIWRHSKLSRDRAAQYELLMYKPGQEYLDFNETEITQHGVAVTLAKSPKELSAINSNVRTISMAAEFFSQIRRVRISPTRVHLEATENLDRFMVKLNNEIIKILQKIGGL